MKSSSNSSCPLYLIVDTPDAVLPPGLVDIVLLLASVDEEELLASVDEAELLEDAVEAGLVFVGVVEGPGAFDVVELESVELLGLVNTVEVELEGSAVLVVSCPTCGALHNN